MDRAKTLVDYRATLQSRLTDFGRSLSEEETSEFRAIVQRRRNGRRSRAPGEAAPHVRKRAEEIVALLAAAAKDLRPRETQELDDLVAGRAPAAKPSFRAPIRMHRNGWPPR